MSWLASTGKVESGKSSFHFIDRVYPTIIFEIAELPVFRAMKQPQLLRRGGQHGSRWQKLLLTDDLHCLPSRLRRTGS